MNTLPLFDGKELRDEGIKRAEVTAGQSWLDEADKYMDKFLSGLKTGDTFMTEDARKHINDLGCIEPAHPRVWGSVILRAVRSGRILKSGIQAVKNPAAHCAYACVWMKI